MTNFLDPNYKIPSTDNYMKFKEGENTFRVLSSAIVGWEYWTQDNNPVRSKTEFKETPNIKMVKNDGNQMVEDRPKHFWMFAVWNYADERVQILELTQKTIMGFMQSLVSNKKWGNPTGYDITVTKEGTGFQTEYTCIANPHSVLEDHIAEAWSNCNIDLTEIYTGGDPFRPTKKEERSELVLPEVDVVIEDDGSVDDPKF